MDKIEREWDAAYTHALIQDKIDEIIDWINAHDKRRASRRIPDDMSAQEYDKAILDSCKPTIEQELESGLREANSRLLSFAGTGGRCNSCGFRKCTRIFLPLAKRRGLAKEMNDKAGKYLVSEYGELKFHDIPVYSYPEDKIIFCTD